MSLAHAQTNVGANLFASCPPCAATNRQQTRPSKSAERGFTLVELIMVIALAGIVAVMISTVMSRPLQGFVDQSRRAELTDLAASALNRMARDIRLAVPNSISTKGNGVYFVPIEAAGRYRGNLAGSIACPVSPAECDIDILSPIRPAKSEVGVKHWLIIYNTEPLIDRPEPSDNGNDVISPKEFTWGNGKLSANLNGFSFKLASPQYRFYLAKEVVGYRCDSEGYLLRETFGRLDLTDQPSTAKVIGSIPEFGCTFTYEPGTNTTNTRNGLVTLRLSLSKDGETITLLQQVHVDNAP
ncbi:prepilin-type N-terminal cleavage/methylation domain-containing protein [Stutzerimonas stutzeri]|uniref:prepilin-type N-terminal cleavage/methylation domain-containing protein n=1 Tax=Stutzerimonas stutzeri TaxID=316 RepID=UPI000698A1B5